MRAFSLFIHNMTHSWVTFFHSPIDISVSTVSYSECIKWSEAFNGAEEDSYVKISFFFFLSCHFDDTIVQTDARNAHWTQLNWKRANVKQMLCSCLLPHFLPLLHHPPLWSMNTKWQKQPVCKDRAYYAQLAINMTIQLDGDANAVSEAFPCERRASRRGKCRTLCVGERFRVRNSLGCLS